MKIKIVSLLITTLFILNYSCKKDDVPSVEENKETLQNLSANVESDLDQIFESEGIKALDALFDLLALDDPLGFDREFDQGFKKSSQPAESSWVLSGIIGRFAQKFTVNDGGFNFNDHTGTYTWNPSIERWSVDAANPADKIVIVFPVEGYTDYAVFTLHDYQETIILDTYYDYWGYLYTDTVYQPSLILADLIMGDVTYVNIDMNAEWDEAGDPENLNIYLLFKPLELLMTYDDDGSKMILSGSVKLMGTKIISADLVMDYSLETDEWGDEELIPVNISGFVHYGPVKVAGTVDFNDIMEMEDEPTIDDINAAVDLTLNNYDGGSKIADIVFIEDQEEELDIQLVFTDGSTEMASVYFDPVIESLEAKLEELEAMFNEEVK